MELREAFLAERGTQGSISSTSAPTPLSRRCAFARQSVRDPVGERRTQCKTHTVALSTVFRLSAREAAVVTATRTEADKVLQCPSGEFSSARQRIHSQEMNLSTTKVVNSIAVCVP